MLLTRLPVHCDIHQENVARHREATVGSRYGEVYPFAIKEDDRPPERFELSMIDRSRKMKLKGSCHCGAVRYECESKHPCPYQLCYCGICRKTTGGGGFSINIGGDASSLVVTGGENITIYQAKIGATEGSSAKVSELRRRFCKVCGSALWFDDDRWPELIHPVASSVDTDLPTPPEKTHIMLDSKPSWVQPAFGPEDKKYGGYPEESLAECHQRLGLEK